MTSPASAARLDRLATSDGVGIAYRQWGDPVGAPVVLHHGFLVDATINWEQPGVVAALADAGYRVIAPDARGHGTSDKPHDADRYGEARMARDLAELVTHLGIGSYSLVGYSMGAVVSLIAASTAIKMDDPRVGKLVVGGVGGPLVEMGGVDRTVVSPDALVAALETDDVTSISDPVARGFRVTAEALGNDLAALAAQARSVHRTPIDLAAITASALLIVGADDHLAQRPERLAGAIQGCRLETVPGDHMTAVGPAFIEAVLAFLAT